MLYLFFCFWHISLKYDNLWLHHCCCKWHHVAFMTECLHTYIHTYTCTHTHTWKHVHMHTLVHTHVRSHVYIHTCVHTCAHTYMHAHMHAHIHTHVHTYARTHVHTCMHTYIHTYIPTASSLSIHTCQWTFRLFPWLGCCELYCYKHSGACIFLNYSFSRHMPWSGVTGSCTSSDLSFQESHHPVFHSGCSNLLLYIPTSSVGGLPFLQHLLLVDFLTVAILISVRWYLIVVLICIFLIIGHVEHLFMRLLTICDSSLEKCLFRSSAHFSVGLFIFLLYKLFVYFGTEALIYLHHSQIFLFIP